jgi:hypothetical protein
MYMLYHDIDPHGWCSWCKRVNCLEALANAIGSTCGDGGSAPCAASGQQGNGWISLNVTCPLTGSVLPCSQTYNATGAYGSPFNCSAPINPTLCDAMCGGELFCDNYQFSNNFGTN